MSKYLIFKKGFWTLPFKRYDHEVSSWMRILAVSCFFDGLVLAFVLTLMLAFMGGFIPFEITTAKDFVGRDTMVLLLPFGLVFLSRSICWRSYYVVAKALGQTPGHFFKWGLSHQFGPNVRALLEQCDAYVEKSDGLIR